MTAGPKAKPNGAGFHPLGAPRTVKFGEYTYVFYFLVKQRGAISGTATAPFDRLKVLITAQPTRNADRTACRMTARSTMSNLMGSLKLIYNEHSTCHTTTPQHGYRSHTWGLKNFFIGNGLNVIKVFTESAIKFFVCEYANKHPQSSPPRPFSVLRPPSCRQVPGWRLI
ncbi:hypothetical protein PCASD_08041 [Puccinia coronata f. sp. avenae]|uniref:Uncharacterized protein n=1 Tax=Puccinia coronata f. sp. avenae TaxID=200324 RepID=A0A2N5UZG6_9BASI|nr:hypothetical protein PCASD_24540 [Puccinia coronata f. sp. avenae]PLW43153.1 hypothetical protein PCASD_08041 [Puccinia coronata f. sp. avenae]